MDISITTERLQLIWRRTWNRLPARIREELDSFVSSVREINIYEFQGRPCKNVYGCYTQGGSVVSLYGKDLIPLSDNAIAAVMAHELGHAYCHLKCGNSAPCRENIENDGCTMHSILSSFSDVSVTCNLAIDTAANLVAQAWGFQDELSAFECEKKPSEGL